MRFPLSADSFPGAALGEVSPALAVTRICLIRHGETDWNAGDRIQGSMDIPLNDVGLAQARATGARLAGEHFDAFYTSDLTRARQTADAIATAIGLAPILDPEFRERRYGVFEGLTRTEASQQYPQEYAAIVRRDADCVPPGKGESLTQHSSRVTAALQRVAAAHLGSSVLIVTHGGVLDLVNRLVRGWPVQAARDFTIPNAGINRIVCAPAGWSIECWADSSHLAAVGRDELR
ncbi:hypothetical protein CKO20_12670 [Rhodocyclus tenuis]|nr:hypothetical protein [Rhodocyclus tenuis]